MKILKRVSVFLLVLMQIFTVNAFADACLYDLKPYNTYVYVVTPDGGLNIRTGPGTEYEIIGKIPDYEGIFVGDVDSTGRWGSISYEGKHGFIAMKQTTKKLPAKEVSYDVIITSPDGYLNYRLGPRSSYQSHDTLPNGTRLHIIGELNGYGLIHHNQEVGWVYLAETTKATEYNNNQNNSQQNNTNKGQATVDDKQNNNQESANKVEETSNEQKDEVKKDESKEETKEDKNTEEVDSSDKGSNKYILIGSVVAVIVTFSAIVLVLINKMRQ